MSPLSFYSKFHVAANIRCKLQYIINQRKFWRNLIYRLSKLLRGTFEPRFESLKTLKTLKTLKPSAAAFEGSSTEAVAVLASTAKTSPSGDVGPAAKTSLPLDVSRANCFYFGFRNCCVAALAAVCCQNQPERRRRPCKLLLYRLSKCCVARFGHALKASKHLMFFN